MKTVARVLFGLVGCALLVLVIMPLAGHEAVASNPAPVFVTNTPLAVQGTISVGNTPSVTLANTPSVSVSNTPSVSIANTPSVSLTGTAPVVNALDGSNNPIPLTVSVQGQPYVDVCNASGAKATCQLQTLPSNMRLVIQTITFFSDSVGHYYDAYVTTTTAQSTVPFRLALPPGIQDQFSGTHQPVHQTTILYADAGSAPSCTGAATDPSSVFFCTITGYLVPVP